ncbi:variant-silencing SET domain-containing protein [Bicyclus anynana]|uniref:Variant-silencing SET domain-containing protein n=1 Tax=Bicyclus anynana TaxID=110368 RepID=A0ABM3M3W6_BICAN|nr:variant-silencing SET domain-containing protein [Bicyclus anynana]
MAKTKRVYGEYKCKICSKLFSEKAGLAQHVQLHTDARPFACRLCTYTGKTKKYLARHAARVHRQPTAHQCRVCDKMFHYKCNLVKHMYAHTNERPFKCEVCNKGFNSTYSLSSHRHVHTGAKPYKCSYCEYACRDNSTLRKHHERHAGVTRVFQCTQCDKTYKTKRILKTHVAEVHLKRDVKTMPCPHCDKMFKSVKLLNNHVRQTHLRLYACQCEICGVTLASKYNMTTHLTSHIDYRPFACSFTGCDKRYKDKAALKKHAIVHYPERQFPCDVCHRTFTRPHRLLAHRKQHAPKRKTVFCDYCGKGFYNKNYVRSHITRKHMYRQHYICDICGLLTYNKPSIVMHLKYGHVSEMDRKCKICKKTYKKHIYLKSHYWNTHSVRYKLNYRRSRGRKLKIVSNETNEESNNISLQHEIKVEHLSESEETTELSLPEANGGSTAAAVKFTDFIERIIMPTVGDEDVFSKEAGIYVDVTSQQEADRVRSEMMRRWRQNGGTKPMKRLQRHYNSVLKKRDFSKVVNEKIEITVFSETESTVPISEYKKTFNTNDSIVETSNSIKDSEHSKNNHLSSVTDEHLNGDIEKIKNDDENSLPNETDREISEHDTEKSKNGVIVDINQYLPSENDKHDKESFANDASIRDELSKAAEGSYENDENTREFTEIISSENIGYENSLAELVKVRKRKCVRNTKDINYIDTGDDGESDKMINNEKIPPENDVITGTSNGDIHIGNNKLEIGNKRKPRNTKCKRTPKKKGNIPKSRSSIKSNDALENDQSNSREDKIGATENDANSTDVAINYLDTHINNIDNLEPSKTKALDVNIQNEGNSTETNKEISSPQIDETLENQTNPKEDAINIDNSLEYTATNRPRRSVRNIKKNVNKDFVSHMDDDNDDEDCDDDDEFVPDNDDADDDKDDEDRDNDDGDENNKSNKFKINTHQCYVCFKLYETKEKLLNHCKEHFDVCNMKMLKKCPLCDYVTELDLVRHVRITHKINLNYLYGTLKDRKNNNTKSRFYFNVKNDSVDEIEVIPSIKNLNRQAALRIDKKRKEKNDKEVKKTKLVKKAGEWIVEKVLINTKKGNYVLPDEVEESLKNDQNKDKNDENTDKNDGNKDKNDKNTDKNDKNTDKNGKNTDKNDKNAGKSCGNTDKNDGNKDKNDRNTDKSDKNTDKNSRNTDKNYKNAGKSCGNRDKKDGNTDKSDENDGKELENEDYCVKMQKLSRIAKKNGQIMLFPCEKCEKICQTFSALKLHIRRHDPNAKPFKKKVWKHKLSEEELRKHQENKEKERNKHFKNKNRYQKPKPIVHKHKCDPKLKDFYEKNIKGGDIEFWQFLKIFNKMSRENVNDFTDLENRPEFGLHYGNSKSNPPQESIDLNKSDLNPHIVAKSGLKPKKNNSKTLDKTKVVKGSFKRKILINKKDYLKRKRMKELLRQKLVDKSNIKLRSP